MVKYSYLAKKGPEETVSGTIEAVNEKEALERLSIMGLVPLSLSVFDETKAFEQDRKKDSAFVGRIPPRVITLFSRQLAALLKSGVPILRALMIIRDQTENRYLKTVIQGLYAQIEAGVNFSAVLSQYPSVFSSLYIALVKAGEDSGRLPEVLFKIAQYRQKQEELSSRLRMAMVYPSLMLVVGISSVIFMLTFVMPKLFKLYKDMGQSLPLATNLLIFISNSLRQWGLWIILAATAVIVLIRRYSLTRAGKMTLSIIQLGLPLISNLVIKIELARFARTLQMLLESGIPILRAINVTLPVLNNELMKTRLSQCLDSIQQGQTLGSCLKQINFVPPFMSNMVIVGEEAGKLAEALAELANTYERDTDETMAMLASLLEPIMIIIMALAVGFIVVAMLLPIFEMNVMVR